MPRGIFGRHIHAWHCIRTVHDTHHSLSYMGPYSIMHWICLECPKVKTTTLNGLWEPDDFE